MVCSLAILPPPALRRPGKRVRWMKVLCARAAGPPRGTPPCSHAGAQALCLEPLARSSRRVRVRLQQQISLWFQTASPSVAQEFGLI